MPPRPELCETEPTDHQRDPADNSDPESGIPTGADGGNRGGDPHRVSGLTTGAHRLSLETREPATAATPTANTTSPRPTSRTRPACPVPSVVDVHPPARTQTSPPRVDVNALIRNVLRSRCAATRTGVCSSTTGPSGGSPTCGPDGREFMGSLSADVGRKAITSQVMAFTDGHP